MLVRESTYAISVDSLNESSSGYNSKGRDYGLIIKPATFRDVSRTHYFIPKKELFLWLLLREKIVVLAPYEETAFLSGRE